MPNKLPRMKLCSDEEVHLRHWMHDEVHYRDGAGPAKLLQRSHGASPAELAALIAAAMPNPEDQAAAGFGLPPAEPPVWPWSEKCKASRSMATPSKSSKYCNKRNRG